MTERRYREHEVRAIFERATSQPVKDARSPSMADGLTLADIQSIGLEVGVGPEEVARAAAALNATALRPGRTSFGMPIEVGRIVPLPRKLTDREWEQLVAELRTTFNAKGRNTVHGGLREWTNGNLHAFIEPTETGYRLRLGTLKGTARGVNALGMIGVIASAVTLGALALTDGPHWSLTDALLIPILFGASGIGAFATNLLRLPRWARERDHQMTQIVSKLRSILGMKADQEL